ncbi:MAG: sulfite exporter TauE/SafE family protein [Bacteroidota bacterium]
MEIWTAFTIGLVGSLHCVGMCGPIALALPFQGQGQARMLGSILLYNLGRVTTYAALGLVIGLVGQGLFIAGLQMYLSIGLGILFLLAAIFSIKLEQKLFGLSFLHEVQTWVKKQLGFLLRGHSAGHFYGIGLLNGLLPCGLVYLGVAGAVTSSTVVGSMQYMIFFGFGTLPLMLLAAFSGQFMQQKWRRRIRQFIPVLLGAFGLFLLYRGLQFQLPQNFHLWERMQDIPMCH